MTGRALLGIVIGGFWSMSAATVMRLVPPSEVPRALGVLDGGNALATTVAAPLGSFLGQYIGWRNSFFAVVPLAALTFGWRYMTLPSMPSRGRGQNGTVFRVLRRRQVPSGIIAVTLFFIGQFVLYTYLRPFLEGVTHLTVSSLSMTLLLMGAAGLAGTYAIGLMLRSRLYSILVALPLAMAGIAVALMLCGGTVPPVVILLAGWGLLSTAAPVAWWTWLSRVLPDDAEAGGGLMVAVIQFAIALGATIGGIVFDRAGYSKTFAVSAATLCASAAIAAMAWWQMRQTRQQRRAA
jgi:predicted MFS family arabinose efflux permease